MTDDCFEMWLRGTSFAPLGSSNIAESFESLESTGIEVVFVVGNHDKRLIIVGDRYEDAVAPGSPRESGEVTLWDWSPDGRKQIGGC
jgi:hypothetical protein